MIAGKLTRLFVVASFGALTAAPAHADLIGTTLAWQYYGGGGLYTSPYLGAVTSGEFVVDDTGAGGTYMDGSPLATIFDITADADTITISFAPDTLSGTNRWPVSACSLNCSGSGFSVYDGLSIDLSGGFFDDVILDPATNMTGYDDLTMDALTFGASNFTFSDDEIDLDWQNMDYSTSTEVKFDVTLAAGSSTPEPATFGLISSSLLLGAALRRRLKAA